MKFLKKDLAKLFLYVASIFLLAALLTPLLYSAGKSLASYAATHESNGFAEWLGEKCANAKFDRFFKRALLLVALLLLYPLIRSMRRPEESGERMSLKSQLQVSQKTGFDLGVGLFLSAGLFGVLAIICVQKGFFVGNGADMDWLKVVRKALVSAIVVSLIEEIVFRGVLLRMLIRDMKSSHAVIGLSVFFAMVHFTQPPHGIGVSDPESLSAGFRFLAEVGRQIFTIDNVIASFFTLMAVSVILSYAWLSTSKLWLSVGLHAGWVFAYQLFSSGFTANMQNAFPMVIGKSLREGLLPLSILAITAGCVILYVRKSYVEKTLR